MQEPQPNEVIVIDQQQYRFVPLEISIGGQGFKRIVGVHAEIGKAGKVYKVRKENENTLFALKQFNDVFRTSVNIHKSKIISEHRDIQGLLAANRTCLTKDNYSPKDGFEQFLYAIHMPWISGKSWSNVVSAGEPIPLDYSLKLARSFAKTNADLEKNGLAHCDLAGGNFIISEGFSEVQLIDIEEMYDSQLDVPKPLPQGTEGYNLPNIVQKGYWGNDADRFSASIIIIEMLIWQSQNLISLKNHKNSETFFDSNEFGDKTSKRFQAIQPYLAQLNTDPNLDNEKLLKLFLQVWSAKTPSDCPPLSEWVDALGEGPGDTYMPKLALNIEYVNYGSISLSEALSSPPTRILEVKNIGTGILEGNIQSFGEVASSPKKSFSLSREESQAYVISFIKKLSNENQGTTIRFPKGIIVSSNSIQNGNKVIAGEISIKKEIWWRQYKFLFNWLFASLVGFLSPYIIYRNIFSIDSIVSSLVLGLSIGLCQYLVLKEKTKVSWWWIIASVTGFFLQSIIQRMFFLEDFLTAPTFRYSLISFAMAGLFNGILQTITIKNYKNSWIHIITNTSAMTFSVWMLSYFPSLRTITQLLIFSMIYGILTGISMNHILSQKATIPQLIQPNREILYAEDWYQYLGFILIFGISGGGLFAIFGWYLGIVNLAINSFVSSRVVIAIVNAILISITALILDKKSNNGRKFLYISFIIGISIWLIYSVPIIGAIIDGLVISAVVIFFSGASLYGFLAKGEKVPIWKYPIFGIITALQIWLIILIILYGRITTGPLWMGLSGCLFGIVFGSVFAFSPAEKK